MLSFAPLKMTPLSWVAELLGSDTHTLKDVAALVIEPGLKRLELRGAGVGKATAMKPQWSRVSTVSYKASAWTGTVMQLVLKP